VNEIWPFLRNLWRARGGYEAEILFNPEIDLKEFGTQYGPAQFYATYKFKITDEGQWDADFDIRFDQVDSPLDDRAYPPEGRKGAFYAQDYSRAQSNTVKRARKLAKPTWSTDEGRSGQDFADLLDEEEYLNNTVDFTFHTVWKGSGDWSNYDRYAVGVSDATRTSMPEKEADSGTEVKSSISLDSIQKLPSRKRDVIIP
jgi:hypothetical protein